MNLGIVTTWFERGAAYVSKQYKDILDEEFKVFIYARGGEEYALGDPKWDAKFVTWGKKINSGVSTEINLKDFEKWLKKNNIEIVLFNEQHWFEPILLCKKMNIKTGAYIDYYTEKTIPLFKCYDFLICNTKKHYETFKDHPQVIYIPWGTDMNLFTNRNYEAVNKGKITFFHSCGYSPIRKGTDILIKAFYRINKEKKLVIHTQCDLKKKIPELEGIINELVLNDQLVLINKTVTAPGLYHLGDIYVYPTRLEGIGLTIIEALSCGLPVITNDYSPMNEFINETNGKLAKIEKFYCREDGYYWPMCEPNLDSLKYCMEYYIDNLNNIEQFKKEARSYAKEKLDWSKNAAKLNEIIKQVKYINNEDVKDYSNEIRHIQRNQNLKVKLYTKYGFILNCLKKILK